MKNPPSKANTRDNPEQSRRFEETARELGTDESGKAFERVFKKVVPASKQKKKSA
jgi:hypothetical protein